MQTQIAERLRERQPPQPSESPKIEVNTDIRCLFSITILLIIFYRNVQKQKRPPSSKTSSQTGITHISFQRVNYYLLLKFTATPAEGKCAPVRPHLNDFQNSR